VACSEYNYATDVRLGMQYARSFMVIHYRSENYLGNVD